MGRMLEIHAVDGGDAGRGIKLADPAAECPFL
jgi:hypothetical protein